jgi:hypothetical protein
MMRNASRIALALAALTAPNIALAQDEDTERQSRVEITPYIEAGQVLIAELSPDNDVVTYTRLAAGVDASINGRYNAAAVSLRYERRIGYQPDDPDGDVISGIARASASIIPRALTIEAGALATRSRVEGNGASIITPITDNFGESNIYAVYGGPTLQTHAGQLEITGQYLIGYTRVEEPDALVTAPGADPVDIFDDSVSQNAQVRLGIRPNTVAPVGVGVGAGWYQEDVSNLDQRVQDRWVRGDVTIPVSPNLALVGGIGYEDVEISSRDALRDGMGDPVVGPDGRYVTDPNSTREIAYETDGLIWDAGVIWRPSRRTSLEAHIGRRYGSMTYYGTLAYAPNSRSSLNVSVYDSVTGFGGQVTRILNELPTDFTTTRNPISGDIGTCVTSLDSGSCFGGALGAIRSSTFRSRGVAATYSISNGRITAGVGGGYDSRKFIAAQGTVLEDSNGLRDETVWALAYLNGRIDERSGFNTAAYANWFHSGFTNAGDTSAFGASVAYYREIARRLTATAAVSVDGVTREDFLEDVWTAAGMLGLRYSF